MSYLGELCEATFLQAARDLFKQNPIMTKEINGEQVYCIEIPFSGGRWVGYEAMWGVFEEVAVKLHAYSWYNILPAEGRAGPAVGPAQDRGLHRQR
jgi:hypothetical protein